MNLDTVRCNIRPFMVEDIDTFMTYRNNMDWMKYQGFKGLTKQEYTKILLDSHSLTDGIQLAIICKQTNTLIGDLYLKREGNSCWIGYAITPEKARHGYVYEAASAVISFLAAQGITCVKADVENGNAASISLLKKLKFTVLNMKSDEQIFGLNLM